MSSSWFIFYITTLFLPQLNKPHGNHTTIYNEPPYNQFRLTFYHSSNRWYIASKDDLVSIDRSTHHHVNNKWIIDCIFGKDVLNDTATFVTILIAWIIVLALMIKQNQYSPSLYTSYSMICIIILILTSYITQIAAISLNKYIIPGSQLLSNADCNIACNVQPHNPSLVSIHSLRDYNEAKELCNTTVSPNECWIGLSDINMQNIFEWRDDTIFDYGSNITQSIFPWNNGKPDENGDCIQMGMTDDYKWDNTDCMDLKICLCNTPSILCPSIANWTLLDAASIIVDDECMTSIVFFAERVITDKQWYNNDNKLHIDYMYSMELDSSTKNGKGGITIYNAKSGSFCEYYYIYLNRTTYTDTDASVSIVYMVDLIETLLITQPLKINFITSNQHIYYLLSVIITNGSNFEVFINDIHHISFNHNNDNVLKDGNSGFIGMKIPGPGGPYKSQSKYMYVSGDPFNVLAADILNTTELCKSRAPTQNTVVPTLPPTYKPSIATIAPSIEPTSSPSRNPTELTSVPTLTPTHHPTEYPLSNKGTLPPLQHPTSDSFATPTIFTHSPSDNPTSFSFAPSMDTDSPTRLLTVQPSDNPTVAPFNGSYGIIISIMFEYQLSMNDSMQIVNILQQELNGVITPKIEDKCFVIDNQMNNILYSTTDINETVINVTIVLCNKESRDIVLSVISNTTIKQDIIIQLAQRIDIDTNKTKILITDDIISRIWSTISAVNSTEIIIVDEDKIENKQSVFTILYILSGIVLCCILLFCIFLMIKMKKERMMETHRMMEITDIGTTDNYRINSISSANTQYDAEEKDKNIKDDEPGNVVTNGIDTNETMTNWLVIKVGLPQYRDAFILNGYESIEFVKEIENEQQLFEIGVDKKGHQRKILAEICRLNETGNDNDENTEIVMNDVGEEGYQRHTYPTPNNKTFGNNDGNSNTQRETLGNDDENNANIGDNEFII